MADNFGPNNVYGNIPRLDSHGRPQLPMFMRWNPDPVGNDASNLSGLNPNLQKVVAQARADNPNLNFVIGNGRRSAADQDLAKSWGWSQVGSKDGGDANVHMQGNAVDLWGLDSNGRVQFDPGQQKQISQAMQAASQKLGVGVNWGGNFKTFKDAPHFELAGGSSAAASGAPEGPTSTSAPPTASSAAAPSGTTLNSSAVIDTLSRNIANIESSGWKNPYVALGPNVPGRGQAIGKYQVMPENVPGWTLAATGQSMTPDQFRANPAAQEAVFRDQMQRSLQLYGPKDAASIWFTGKPFNVAGGGASDRYTTNASYVARATAGLPDTGTFTPGRPTTVASATPGSTINTTGGPSVGSQTGSASGSPTLAAGGVASTPGTSSTGQPAGALAGVLPGFQPNSPGAQMTASGLQTLAGGRGGAPGGGGGGGDQPPQPIPAPPLHPALASGGVMMMGPGGQNTFGARAAEQALAQQGFMTQPSIAYNTMGGARPPVPSSIQSSIQAMAPGAATGMPSMPGTTLNSPSQLQMALMTGAMNPYDLYANNAAAYGGGSGSM